VRPCIRVIVGRSRRPLSPAISAHLISSESWHPRSVEGVTDYVGGARGPTKGGSRVHATWPLVRLSIGPGRLVLSGRGPLRRFFCETVADPAEVSVEPVRNAFRKGLVIVTKHGRWLFLTSRQKDILAELSKQGAYVAEERKLR
jgi:hypothetical protein